MSLFDFFKRTLPERTPVSQVDKRKLINDTVLQIAQEFQDRSRKNITKWRESNMAAENPDDPRWYLLQDLIDDLILDAHLASVIDVRKSATLNHRFYVRDKKTKETLEEQTDLLNRQWFYEFLDGALDSVFRKYTVAQFFRTNDRPAFKLIPRRNVCPQLRRMYIEVSGSAFVNYGEVPNVIEIIHAGKFGLINDVIPNVIWKRDALQAYAEFSERFGKPLITATTNNKAEAPRISKALVDLGDSGTGVLPTGTTITVHDLANAGNPEKTYIENAKLQDNQVSKRMIGSTTIVDEGANRSQTQVHIETLDDKIAQSDRRNMIFCVNDQLFPVLQNLGFPFNTDTMEFVFDETEDLTLNQQWEITKGAIEAGYELDIDELVKTFNLPITGKRQTQNPLNAGFSANFR
jgi:hypothetical protein